jgi:hypothetical protein
MTTLSEMEWRHPALAGGSRITRVTRQRYQCLEVLSVRLCPIGALQASLGKRLNDINQPTGCKNIHATNAPATQIESTESYRQSIYAPQRPSSMGDIVQGSEATR